ncbi:S6e family ribosomal protein [Candidatus Nitrosocosmicus franklandus]|uniref:Small ribosomal subunit protein eS6 n=1 Tax=Candidatus Nitrosocosmicus franklandianus TaxID=1798806 RepID=A0A484IFC6_9ARCH|nr:S6e family ribosomal protein [Candidatus Nitrosocosmicus franklandus]VFJ13694.1 30S ribosomal protein S6e [Candidatus Nitrosocosmicus franklandus]
MVEFKVVISDSTGKSTTQDLKDKSAQPLLGSKLGDVLESSIFGLNEGKVKLTGGSDKSGTPMRSDLHGATKKYVLMTKGVGMRNLQPGERKRKLVRGNLVTEEIYQLNCQLIDAKLPEKEQPAAADPGAGSGADSTKNEASS